MKIDERNEVVVFPDDDVQDSFLNVSEEQEALRIKRKEKALSCATTELELINLQLVRVLKMTAQTTDALLANKDHAQAKAQQEQLEIFGAQMDFAASDERPVN